MLLRWFGRLIAESYDDLARSLGVLPPESLELMVDAAALVAAAEGREESRRVARSEATEALAVARQLGNLDRLGMEASRRRFERTVSELHAGGEEARRRVIDRLRPLSGKPELARLALHTAGSVAAVDGQVSDAEQAMIDRIAAELGLPPDS